MLPQSRNNHLLSFWFIPKIKPLLQFCSLYNSIYSIWTNSKILLSCIMQYWRIVLYLLLFMLKSDLSCLGSFVWQGRALYHISKAFGSAASKLEKTGYGILTSPFLFSCGSLSYCVFLDVLGVMGDGDFI